MSFANEASKLLTNKYFLYFMVFLAATNILGYLVTYKLNAVAFFALVSLITYQFSKNMAVILLVGIISTNFLMANKRMREGLENQTTQALSQIENKDKDIANAIPAVQNAENNEEISVSADTLTAIRNKGPGKLIDSNNTDLNTSNEEGPIGAGQQLGNKKTKTNENIVGSGRLDYAATIAESYKNLDDLLGSDSINKLTKDTRQLMDKQKQLFDTMQNMVPVLKGAKDLLKEVDVGGLTDSLKSIGGLVNVGMPTVPKN